jgi:hypothetical protein
MQSQNALEALSLLGNARSATLLYVVGARRCIWAFQHPLPGRTGPKALCLHYRTIALATSSSLLALNELRLLAVGLVLSTFAFACIEITSQLYLLNHVTTVFVSFRDVAQLGPPMVCALLLSLFSLSSVFVPAGLMMLASSLLSRRIPRPL